ncbi:SURF1 family protein [Undibacterium sp. CY18W]|uniref:SURF1-like protein n=1 Tax=Undibacterium hunanense TaxID=2762292 RepID=A0ABR6ZKI5_9BURK|nr:SURF1 family protein [Undibacterium hunanense]MBC3916376.1 SURF1 family protein [Undibacterium hunanense]
MNAPGQGIADKKADLVSKADQPKHLARHSNVFRLAFTVCMFAIFSGFISLGTWQILRLQWKLDLIERVEQRVHAAPVPIPDFSLWPHINASADEYRHVQLDGVFLHEKTVLVLASTELGGGFWVMTPLETTDQATVLVNRGFIPEKMAASYRTASTKNQADSSRASTIHVTGLLRMTEPGGGFLRKNDPDGNRWYSRDVLAIATATGLTKSAPFFIDADASLVNDKRDTQQNDGSANTPVAGLTVIHFHNNHLVYAAVWFLLAAMTAAAWAYVIRDRKNVSNTSTGSAA